MSIAIPPWRCSVLYQGKNVRQKVIAAVMSRKRPGKPGWYFRVLPELRLGERVVVGHLGAAQRAGHAEIGEQLRGALARHRLVIGAPRSECSVSTWGWTPCLWQVSSMRRPASAEFSRSATIQPTA